MPILDADSETETGTEAAIACEDDGGYCAEVCGYGYYQSEEGGCGPFDVCCLPYYDDYSCLWEPTGCADIAVDEDDQYFGCCWANTVYWCDSGYGDAVQSEPCSSTETYGYSEEEEVLWCL